MEYYTQWLNLLGKDDEPLQEELATEKVIETVKRLLHHLPKKGLMLDLHFKIVLLA